MRKFKWIFWTPVRSQENKTVHEKSNCRICGGSLSKGQFSVHFLPPKQCLHLSAENRTAEVSDSWCRFMFPKKRSANCVCVCGHFLHNIIIVFWSLENKNHFVLFCALNTPKSAGKIRRFSTGLGKGQERCPGAPRKAVRTCTHHDRLPRSPVRIPLRIVGTVSSEGTIKTKPSSAAYWRHHCMRGKGMKNPVGMLCIALGGQCHLCPPIPHCCFYGIKSGAVPVWTSSTIPKTNGNL